MTFTCPHCKQDTDVILPLGFRATCDHCNQDLHSCVMCTHHDFHYANECRESQAEPVRDKDRANRCDWFSPRAQNGTDQVKSVSPADEAKRKLEDMFKK